MGIYTLALDKGESLDASLQEAGPTTLNLREKVEDCLLKRTHLTAASEIILDGVFAILRDKTSVLGRDTLQAQQGMLEEAKQKMVEAAKMTPEVVLLDYEHAADHRTEGQAKEKEVGGLIQNAKNLAASLNTLVAQPAGGGGQDGSCSNHLLYEKRPLTE